jgi:glycosyl transferase family 25
VKIVVINLERSADRCDLMRRNLGGLGLEFELFRGIDAWLDEHLSLSRHDDRASILHHGKPLTVGEVGCFASHYLVWQRCVTEKQPLVILEDDVMLSGGFPVALSVAREFIGRLRLIRLGLVSGGETGQPVDVSSGFDVVQYPSGAVSGMQGYVLSPEGAANLVAHASVWSLPVDRYVSRAQRHGVSSFGIHPLTVEHADQQAYPAVIGGNRWGSAENEHVMQRKLVRFLSEQKTEPSGGRINPA